ncbi:hypothetical protein [Nocardioides perillae]|uniref:Uncharacterized protein n=1 Tax=Nocardioides perillae TaxID=1119534 RepID=A0A7Y9RUA6_9ACTN|nr:hypothetical protein [Nocardioides perillae]NYG56752.1 hypothetical protein [Nocardioides perillae]
MADPAEQDQQSSAADTFDALHGGPAVEQPDQGDAGEQRSNVQNLDDAGEPVSDSQSVAGQPTADAEGTQEGGVGPNSIPPGNAERTGIDHDGKAAPEGDTDREA